MAKGHFIIYIVQIDKSLSLSVTDSNSLCPIYRINFIIKDNNNDLSSMMVDFCF